MKRRSLFVIGGITVILAASVIVGATASYLISPLFIDNTVDEAFPFEVPDKEAMAQMSDQEMEEMEVEFVAAIPSEAELEQMPKEELQAVATAVMEVALEMPVHQVDEPMPDSSEAMEAEAAEPIEAEATATPLTEAEPTITQPTEEATAEPQVDESTAMEEEIVDNQPAQPVILWEGQFQDADSFHQGSGSATIYQLPDGSQLLRFEDFMATNGPDLHVLLATNPAPGSRAELGDYIDLGSLKGNVGNQNYEIPAGTDLSQYNSIVIYCMPFHVVLPRLHSAKSDEEERNDCKQRGKLAQVQNK